MGPLLFQHHSVAAVSANFPCPGVVLPTCRDRDEVYPPKEGLPAEGGFTRRGGPGRTAKTVENYVNGEVGNAEYASDRTTEYEFDSSGRLVTLTARNPKGDSVEAQQTRYLHDSDYNRSWPTKIVYPDSSNGMSRNGTTKVWTITSGSDHVAITYDRLGRKVTSTDQRDVVHAYAYDSAGRFSSDDADTQADPLPAGVDSSVVKLGRAYDDLGRLQTITSYDPSDAVVNETKITFDAWGNVKESKQNHADDVEGEETQTVTYTYDDNNTGGPAAVPYVRLKKITYPGASREVYYNYPTSDTDPGYWLSRLENTASAASPSDSQKFAEYTYLGAGTVVEVKYPAVTVSSKPLVLTYGTGGTYGGFDRFGRIVNQKWEIKDAAPANVKDQFKYGYDRASNRTWREVAPDGGNPTGFDEYYTYDGLHRLEKAERGTLAGSPYSSITSHTKRQDFGLDALGNWHEYKEDAGDGSEWDLDQDRYHNAVNEIEGNSGDPISGSPNWIDPNYKDSVGDPLPGYDGAGNMLSGPKPGAESGGGAVRQWYVWDAWNRLVAVWEDDGDDKREFTGTPPDDTLVLTLRYDGLGRRIQKIAEVAEVMYDYYYNEAWQLVETHKDGDVYQQYVWDIRYIDAPVCRDEDKSNGEGGDPDGDCTDPATGVPGSNSGDEHLYYCQDANMNTTALVESYVGEVVERYMYDPYGKPTVLHGVRDSTGTATTEWNIRGSTNTFQNAILYCGYFFDDESGLYHVRNRYLNSSLGRWLSRDPLRQILEDKKRGLPTDRFALSMSAKDKLNLIENLYEYVKSLPTSRYDPSGLGCCGPDIGQALRVLKSKVESDFWALSPDEQYIVCTNMISSSGWDIGPLVFGCPACTSVPGCGTFPCQEFIAVDGVCHLAYDVNYILWGWMNGLCGSSQSFAITMARNWTVAQDVRASLGTLLTLHPTLPTFIHVGPAMDWTMAGYNGTYSVSRRHPSAGSCTITGKKYPGTLYYHAGGLSSPTGEIKPRTRREAAEQTLR